MIAKLTKISNRERDLQIDKRVQFVLDALYEKEGFNFKRTTDAAIDMRGVDVTFKLPGASRVMWADEKTATHYWDRDLMTYSCELLCRKTKNGYGWFAKENNDYMLTTHYVFVWVRALEPELKRISSVKMMWVNKKDLQKYFMAAVGGDGTESTDDVIEKLMPSDVSRCRINDDVTLVKANICPEYPVNALFSMSLLSSLAVMERDYDRFAVRDAIVAKKQKMWDSFHAE